MAGFEDAARTVVARSKQKKPFDPGGDKGKLHRALGVPEGEKIPAAKLAAAKKSRDLAIRDMAIRAETMAKWHHR